eukprot:6208680-Pleurochrysis_carterae.AAC.2
MDDFGRFGYGIRNPRMVDHSREWIVLHVGSNILNLVVFNKARNHAYQHVCADQSILMRRFAKFHAAPRGAARAAVAHVLDTVVPKRSHLACTTSGQMEDALAFDALRQHDVSINFPGHAGKALLNDSANFLQAARRLRSLQQEAGDAQMHTLLRTNQKGRSLMGKQQLRRCPPLQEYDEITNQCQCPIGKIGRRCRRQAAGAGFAALAPMRLSQWQHRNLSYSTNDPPAPMQHPTGPTLTYHDSDVCGGHGVFNVAIDECRCTAGWAGARCGTRAARPCNWSPSEHDVLHHDALCAGAPSPTGGRS